VSRRLSLLLAAVVLPVVIALGVAAGSAPATTRGGGTLRVALPQEIPTPDPALWRPLVQAVWYATCAPLMAWRDTAAAPDGFEVRPEAAAGPPKISRDGRRYVFTVRKGLRFSDGSPLRAANFARALQRVLNPVMGSPSAYFLSDVKRVSASGERLRIELSRRDGDLPTRLALPFACPVPLGFPVDPTGIDLTVGSGPYYVAGYVPHKQLVLERNRYYKGTRPHRVGRIVITSGGDINDAVRAVAEGRADVVGTEIPREIRDVLARTYGVNKRQLFRIQGLFTIALVLNTARPLFRHNIALRKAVNLAVQRTEIGRAGGGWPLSFTATDQILPRWIPGWTDYRLYPLAKPNLRLARTLARGKRRRAIMYVSVGDPLSKGLLDEAQVIVRNLHEIGLEVEVKQFSQDVLTARAGTPGEPYDIILDWFGSDSIGTEPAYPDPAGMIDQYLAGKNARKSFGNTNFSYFDNPAYNRQMVAADRLSGLARFRAFSKIDAKMMRNYAPWVPLTEGSSWLFLSKRVGCLKLHPVYRRDYAAMCLR